MYYGSAWYPEHWPVERWATDLRLMREAGMNVARIGEFAWSRMEPAEGQWDLDWLVRAVDLAGEHGIAIVLGTPTATPPAWLTAKYPDVLAVGPTGLPAAHGSRCHYNPCSERYLDLCAGIASRMARRFGAHPNVIGWQIDNEYWRVSYDGATRTRFQAWLRERYGSLDALNRQWTTAYWSQEYSDWSQIAPPGEWGNPCLEHAFRHFMTDVYRRYQRVQLDAIRAHARAGQWITHNAHAHEWLDWVAIGQEWDLAAWDPYLGAEHLDAERFGFVSDQCRNIRPDRKHWIMETQPARVSWGRTCSDLHRGETRNLVWHFVGHGAEAVLFWQWRCALGGQEQYHGSLLGNDGEPRAVYAEIAQAGKELAKVAPMLANKRPVADVAVVHTFPDRWALAKQKLHAEFDPMAHAKEYYAAARRTGVTVDVVDPAFRDLTSHRLVMAPSLHLLSADTLAKIEAFVTRGGHLLLGPRSGFKDEHNTMLPSRQPGERLAALLGASVAEYFALEKPAAVSGTLGGGTCSIWAEPLDVKAGDVEVLATFGDGNAWLAGRPAVVTRKCGKGRITYCGAWLESRLTEALVSWAMESAGVRLPAIATPRGVTLHELVGDDGIVCILNNCTDEPREVALPAPARDLLTGETRSVRLSLGPRGVAVLGKRGGQASK
jgi:beta-galactosidase